MLLVVLFLLLFFYCCCVYFLSFTRFLLRYAERDEPVYARVTDDSGQDITQL